jgi:hypothetical protein
MALKTCRECGHQVSSSAKACPGCGRSIRHTSPLALGCAAIIGFGLLAALVGELGRQGGSAGGGSPTKSNDRLGSDLGPKAEGGSSAAVEHSPAQTMPSRRLGDGWGIENADAFLDCASQRTRWTHSDLRDTWIILEPRLRRTNMTPHEAQAFVVMLAFAATASDLSIQDARQGMRQALEQANGRISRKTKRDLDEKYSSYCR